MTIDLHLHTTCSDGLRTPEQTVQEAVKKGLTVIAITDHDITTGVDRAILAAQNVPVEVIPGVEINCILGEEEIHILGYYIDIQATALQTELSTIREARVLRTNHMIERLQNLGYDITLQDIKTLSEDGAIGRPHIARALVRKNYFRSTDEVFIKLLTPGKKAYVERYRISPAKAIELIRMANGVPVIAHPGLYKQSINWDELIDQGLQGIEVYHTKHDYKMTKELEAVADKYSLIKTGGSDCHGIGSSSIMGTLDILEALAINLKDTHTLLIKNN